MNENLLGLFDDDYAPLGDGNVLASTLESRISRHSSGLDAANEHWDMCFVVHLDGNFS